MNKLKFIPSRNLRCALRYKGSKVKHAMSELLELAANPHARKLFLSIKKYNDIGKNAYRNELLHDENLNMSGPTLSKYLWKLLNANLIITNYSEIETSESFYSIETGKEINRGRKIWVRIFHIANNDQVNIYNQYISNYL